MDAALKVLNEREVGNLPLSYATAMAIEALCGIRPDFPTQQPPLFRYQAVWINLTTLFRNCYHSLTREQSEQVTALAISMVLLEELQVIDATLVKLHQSVKVIHYYDNYEQLGKRFPKAMRRLPNTDRQWVYANLEREALSLTLPTISPPAVLLGDAVRDPHHALDQVVFLTHCPVDLLARYHFKRLDLLESRTGKIKPAGQWWSKLHGGKDLHRIPFNSFTLQLFGDGTHFSPLPLKYRRAVLELAESKRWSALTTMEKIRHDLSGIVDEDVREVLLSLSR